MPFGLWQQAQIVIGELLTGHREKHFVHDDSPEVEQVTQNGCVVSIPGGFQNMTGLSSEQPSLIS